MHRTDTRTSFHVSGFGRLLKHQQFMLHVLLTLQGIANVFLLCLGYPHDMNDHWLVVIVKSCKKQNFELSCDCSFNSPTNTPTLCHSSHNHFRIIV